MSDFDGDGFIDAVDTDGDGYLDTYDTDGDGDADTFDPTGVGNVDTGFDASDPSGVGTSAGYDVDGDGLVDGYDVDGDGFVDTTAGDAAAYDGGGTTFLDDDRSYTQAEQAQGYSASDTSFIEPPDAAGSTSLISDQQDPGL